MKSLNQKIILSWFFFICLPLSLMAQVEKPTEKGNVLLGGRFGTYYSSEKYEGRSSNYKHYNLSCLPDVGYFFTDNLALGLTCPLIIDWDQQRPYIVDKSEAAKSYSIGLGPYMKYYSNIGIITVLSITYNHFYLKYQLNPYKYSVFQISPGAGYAIFINQKVSLEMTVSYQYKYTSDSQAKDKEHSVHLNAGFQIFL